MTRSAHHGGSERDTARPRLLAVVITLALLAAACASGDDTSSTDQAESDAATTSSTNDGGTDAAADDQTDAAADAASEGASSPGDDASPAPIAEPLFPIVDGRVEVPASWPVADQLDWMLDALAASSTTEDEVEARFSSAFLDEVPTSDVVSLIESARLLATSFDVVEITFLTPIAARLMIGDPAAAEGLLLDLQVEHSTGQILLASLNPFPYEDSNTYPQDVGITFEAGMARLEESADAVGVVVAAIDGAECRELAGHNADQPLATGSNFKGYVLGALAAAVEAGELSLDAPVVVTEDERAPASFTDDIPAGAELSLVDAAALMMGMSDNTMTDHLHELVGREAVEQFVVEAGHADPSLLTPFVSVNEWDNLIFSIDNAQAQAYLAATDDEQRAVLDDVIVAMRGTRVGGFANYAETLPLSWNASPLDMCRLMARLRQFEPGTDARRLVDVAYGSGGVLVGVRRHWDITWFKGGGIPTSDGTGLDVLTYGWMVENAGGAYAVVVMSNNGPVDEFDSASISQRIHRILLDELATS